jgi:RNA recognition motif-containing protein
VYHLPREVNGELFYRAPASSQIMTYVIFIHLDDDLMTLFCPFGPVISARVYVDKKSDESKGFGFVSFAFVDSATSAIASMNAFQVGSKRLKVQHKRVVDDVPSMNHNFF